MRTGGCKPLECELYTECVALHKHKASTFQSAHADGGWCFALSRCWQCCGGGWVCIALSWAAVMHDALEYIRAASLCLGASLALPDADCCTPHGKLW